MGECRRSQESLRCKNTVFIDSSTIDIPTSREIHQYVKTNIEHFDFVDAPVSGGVTGARKRTLCFMLSRPNKEAISPSLQKLIENMGSNLFPCGGHHGSGLATKLSNNYLLAITNLAVADSFQLAKSFGLNLQNYAKWLLNRQVSRGLRWIIVLFLVPIRRNISYQQTIATKEGL